MTKRITNRSMLVACFLLSVATFILTLSGRITIDIVRSEISGISPLSEPTETIAIDFVSEEEATHKKAVTIASEYEIELIAKTMWGEAENIESDGEVAAVGWCILNRVDYSGLDIETIVTAENQFHGYSSKKNERNIPDRFIALAEDVIARWYDEKDGDADVGRTLPVEYMWFFGDGTKNYFTDEYPFTSKTYDVWAWLLPSPYENDISYGMY